MKLELVHVGSHRRVILNRRSVLIGRESDADLRVNDPEVGPYECLISETCGPSLTVWSLGTDTGHTLVNGQPITKANLMPGDRLTVGKTEFEVRYELEPHSTMEPPHWLRGIRQQMTEFGVPPQPQET